MNPGLSTLQPYPFQRLAKLLEGITVPQNIQPVALTIGEPQHPPPQFVLDCLRDNLALLSQYPTTKGLDLLREACASWLQHRFNSTVCPDTEILPVNGTREALFAFAQAMLDTSNETTVVIPNPCYQIYEGAAFLAGATPWYQSNDEHFLPDLDSVPEQIWQQCQLYYLCSPGNPTGSVWPKQRLMRLLELADKYDFIIAADECYSEIYTESPPPGLLEVCTETGRTDFARCVVFHSLSKRSNLPGLRSGFVAGDAKLISAFLSYRTYHGCAMSVPNQHASAAAWADEIHVEENRRLYREKFTAAVDILGATLKVATPPGSFYLWPQTPIDDAAFARDLYANTGVKVLPGSFLSRDVRGNNPGTQRIRLSLVPELEYCIDAATAIRHFTESLQSTAA